MMMEKLPVIDMSPLLGGTRQASAHVAREIDDACRDRSEEHTSELQSLMRISYAVFCLKKKTNNYPQILPKPQPIQSISRSKTYTHTSQNISQHEYTTPQ